MAKKEVLNKQAVEAVRNYYNCCDEHHGCCLNKYCRYGTGSDTAWDCNECEADEYYEGYIQALKDMVEKNTALLTSTTALQTDIQACLGRLVGARLFKNKQQETEELLRMDSLMVSTAQQLQCIIDYLKEEK